ncbi:MAG: L-aspartate oxidase [Elusimicrobiales bacterium]
MAESDFLVVGSGLAGMMAALELAGSGTVNIITKRDALASSSAAAQGGVAAAVSPEDSFASHEADTLLAGAGLCDENAVKIAVSQGPECIRRLLELGAKFSRKNGLLELGLEGGHSRRRIIHSRDLTGLEISRTLEAACRKHPNIRIFESRAAIDLILRGHARDIPPDKNRCFGAYALSGTGKVELFSAKFTVIASGGAGKVYRYTSNPDCATGDGMAMAYRAGVPLKNMEFVQFHPTCLYHPRAKSFLISEAVRGEGAILRLANGRPFMKQYSPLAELAPRDIVARAIDSELKRSGADCVFLDITAKKPDFIKRRFPYIYRTCLSYGIDMAKEPVPVVPAAHFFCGGIETGAEGRTVMDGLYAVGEAACTGLHGANRLASNSLLEACVFARRAAGDIKSRLPSFRRGAPRLTDWKTGRAVASEEAVIVAQNWEEIRALMWNYVGIVRTDKRLERAARRMQLINDEIRQYYWDFLVTRDVAELRNIACVAEAVIRSAALRRESRGLHYNADYPRSSPDWLRPTVIDRYR